MNYLLNWHIQSTCPTSEQMKWWLTECFLLPIIITMFGSELVRLESQEKPIPLWYSLKWCLLRLNGIRWQNHITHGPWPLCQLITFSALDETYTPRTPQNLKKSWNIDNFLNILWEILWQISLARNTHKKKKKSLHTFDEEPLFINWKILCRYRNRVSSNPMFTSF